MVLCSAIILTVNYNSSDILSFSTVNYKIKERNALNFLYCAENYFPRVYKTLICFFLLLFFWILINR